MKNKVIDSDRFKCFLQWNMFPSVPPLMRGVGIRCFSENGRKCGSFVTGGTGKKPASFRLPGGPGGSFGSAALVLAPAGI